MTVQHRDGVLRTGSNVWPTRRCGGPTSVMEEVNRGGKPHPVQPNLA